MITSIIIPVHNQLALTRLCIGSIREHTRPGSYELIVVDNGSTDGTAEWLERQPDVRLIRCAENEGFPAACNRGLAAATGDNILLLNNDTVVTPRWLDNLLGALHSRAEIGAVGPVTNAAAYHTSIPVFYRNLEEMRSFADAHNRPDPAKWEERVKLIGFCLLFKREAFEKAGFLDERFAPGNFEDDDYCLRIRLAGYRLLLCRDTFIHHFGSASFRAGGPQAFAELMRRNEEKFAAKWGFSSVGACALHEDLIALADVPKEGTPCILDASCGCGATLLGLLRRFPDARLYGLERNREAARVAGAVLAGRAQVRTPDPGRDDAGFPPAFFDLILFGLGWEKLRRPRETLRSLAASLKPEGVLLARFHNPHHHQMIFSLLDGNWPYAHLYGMTPAADEPVRFWTPREIGELFREAGFGHVAAIPQAWPVSAEDERFLLMLCRLVRGRFRGLVPEDRINGLLEQLWDRFAAAGYLVRASREAPPAASGQFDAPASRRLKFLLRRIEWDVDRQRSLEAVVRMAAEGTVGFGDIGRVASRDLVRAEETMRLLAEAFRERGLAASAEEFPARAEGEPEDDRKGVSKP